MKGKYVVIPYNVYEKQQKIATLKDDAIKETGGAPDKGVGGLKPDISTSVMPVNPSSPPPPQAIGLDIIPETPQIKSYVPPHAEPATPPVTKKKKKTIAGRVGKPNDGAKTNKIWLVM